MTTAAQFRPVLRVVEPTDEAYTWFCGHCGAPSPDTGPVSRVCPECESGLLLGTHPDALPGPDDAFLVIDSSLTVQAVSRHAEAALGIREELAINRHVTELLIPGDAEPGTHGGLADAVVRAARGERLQGRVAVRPSQTFGIRLLARISACGPPSAALVVLDRATA